MIVKTIQKFWILQFHENVVLGLRIRNRVLHKVSKNKTVYVWSPDSPLAIFRQLDIYLGNKYPLGKYCIPPPHFNYKRTRIYEENRFKKKQYGS